MNTVYAFIAVCSFAVSIGSLLALLSKKLHRRAAAILGLSVVAFVVSLSFFNPDKSTSHAAIDGRTGAIPVPQSAPAAGEVKAGASPAGTGSPGVARVCLTDNDAHLGPNDELAIPATTVFEDDGPNGGKVDDPSSWAYETKEGFFHAALVTLSPIVLRQKARCAETKVQMLTDSLRTATSETAAGHHLFAIADVLVYPIPAKQPPIEIGKLIDDISIEAVLLSDVTQFITSPQKTLDDATRSAQCLVGAKNLAAYVGGGVGRQTDRIVGIGAVAATDVSYGCAFGPKDTTNLFVGWDGQAQPPAPTVAFIMKAGEYLTGAMQSELRRETTACVSDALKPDSGELADRQFRGVKIECQAFTRDGGGGDVTIYRRFGSAPERPEPSAAALESVSRNSNAIKLADSKNASDALQFARWYRDPSIPQKIKVFAMMTARIITLGERCPSAKPRGDKIAQWAADAGITNQDIQLGGRYAPLIAMMMTSMRAGAAKESVEKACEAAKQYD
ncbi:MAG TPA: hypothetical protein VH206_14370 [Xanthobacteraceae bacterium]|nr:hypothetical protein [Xanthobacteraceae bacterium]